jgi:hypothetical protein
MDFISFFFFPATTKQEDSISCINFGIVCEEDKHRRHTKLFTVKAIKKWKKKPF